jgi:putative thiamine transport system substrate-binding protein
MRHLPFASTRRNALAAMLAGLATPLWAQGRSAWPAVESRARGQTVYFNAWAGSEQINAYLQWAAAEVLSRHGVRLEHVKISDAAEVVKRVRAEKAAGKQDGTVDLVWINGENFLTMKRESLLFGPFAESLPAFQLVDVVGKPTTRIDFSEPVEGMEAPWGMAQLTFFADRRKVPTQHGRTAGVRPRPSWPCDIPPAAQLPWHHVREAGPAGAQCRSGPSVPARHACHTGRCHRQPVGLS